MRLGLFSYNVDYGARPDELARAAEQRGFESFWVGVEDMGVERVTLVSPRRLDDALPFLDRMAALATP